MGGAGEMKLSSSSVVQLFSGSMCTVLPKSLKWIPELPELFYSQTAISLLIFVGGRRLVTSLLNRTVEHCHVSFLSLLT